MIVTINWVRRSAPKMFSLEMTAETAAEQKELARFYKDLAKKNEACITVRRVAQAGPLPPPEEKP